jgi:hypothetical protein
MPKPFNASLKSTALVLLAAFAPAGLAAQSGGGPADDRDSPEARAELLVRLIEKVAFDEKSDPTVLGDIDLRRAPESVLKIARALKEDRIDVKVAGQEIDLVLDLLRKVSGLNINVSKRAKEKLDEEGPRLDLDLRGLPLENVLNLLAMQLGEYRFIIRYGTLMLVLKEEYRPRKVLRVYSVSDLIRVPPDFPAPKLGLGSGDEN